MKYVDKPDMSGADNYNVLWREDFVTALKYFLSAEFIPNPLYELPPVKQRTQATVDVPSWFDQISPDEDW